MQSQSYLPDDLQLYLALVSLLREQGLACASMQIDCKQEGHSPQHWLSVTGTGQAKRLLRAKLEGHLGRGFDPDQPAWRFTLDEAWKLIDCCTVR